MSEPACWRALAPLVVAGKPVKVGETFTAPASTVAALLGRLVEADLPEKPRRKQER